MYRSAKYYALPVIDAWIAFNTGAGNTGAKVRRSASFVVDTISCGGVPYARMFHVKHHPKPFALFKDPAETSTTLEHHWWRARSTVGDAEITLWVVKEIVGDSFERMHVANVRWMIANLEKHAKHLINAWQWQNPRIDERLHHDYEAISGYQQTFGVRGHKVDIEDLIAHVHAGRARREEAYNSPARMRARERLAARWAAKEALELDD